MAFALITGASAGLGVEFARQFAKDGYSLILVARRKEALEKVRAGILEQYPQIEIDVIPLDLGSPGAGRELMAKLGNREIEALVNNAGFGAQGDFADIPLERQLAMIDLNIRTLVELTHLVLPQMRARRRGHILNVGSTAGFQPGPYMAVYYATKAFVNSFSEALHEELKGSGVTCTNLAPGATATEFASAANMTKSRLFNSGLTASAAQVAQAGYRAMKKGKALIVTGLPNKLFVQTQRLSTRALNRKVAAMLNKNG